MLRKSQTILHYYCKLRLMVVCICTLLTIDCVYGLSNDSRQFIRLSTDFGYSCDINSPMNPPLPQTDFTLNGVNAILGRGYDESLLGSNGVGVGVSFGYRKAWNVMLFDIGLGCDYRYINNQVTPLSAIEDEIDEENYPYIGYYTWHDRVQLRHHIGVDLPLMVGAYKKQFYMLAGIKASLHVWGVSAENGNNSLRASYDRYVDDFTDMYEHGFIKDVPYQTEKIDLSTKFNLSVCAEIGYMFDNNSYSVAGRKGAKPIHTLSAFVEYAVVGQGYYCPLTAGIRWSILFPLKSANCLCYE